MKGVVLAGGTGSRLYPLTKVTNKHLLPVGRYPMIFHALYKLIRANIREIMVVTGREHMGEVVNLLGSGREFGSELTYRVQDEAGGIAQALGLAESFAGSEAVTVILGDNVFSDDITPYVHSFAAQGSGAKVLITGVDDPQRYGVPELVDGKVLSIEEKPEVPKSSYAVTGVYMYDPMVFDIIKTLRPSHRGELEVTDINNAYIKAGLLTFDVLTGWWTDAGTHASLAKANSLAAKLELDDVFGRDRRR